MVCAHCGSELPRGALFCGECGRSVAPSGSPVRKPAPAEVKAEKKKSDTLVIEPVEAEPALPERIVPDEMVPDQIVPDQMVPDEMVPDEPVSPSTPPSTLSPIPSLTPNGAVTPDVAPTMKEVLFVDLEATRIVTSAPTGDRFVLQFSTGESVTVFGTGLIGRHPVAEPGEYFDHLVTISDPSKSVSKTHLEFGQISGAFWISDRHSGNGTLVREPDSETRRCDPGKRYRVVRGTRVSIGEQFFVVS